MPADLLDAAARLRHLADQLYPGHRGAVLVIHQPDGTRLVVRVGESRAPTGSPTGDMAEAVMQAMEEADGPLTGEQLAERSGYSNSGAFRRTVRSLVAAGRLVAGRPGQPGYSLPEV